MLEQAESSHPWCAWKLSILGWPEHFEFQRIFHPFSFGLSWNPSDPKWMRLPTAGTPSLAWDRQISYLAKKARSRKVSPGAGELQTGLPREEKASDQTTEVFHSKRPSLRFASYPKRRAVQDPRAKRPSGAEGEAGEDEIAVWKTGLKRAEVLQAYPPHRIHDRVEQRRPKGVPPREARV